MRVFISHSALDRDLVEREIITPLRQHGVETWYSKHNIKTAAEWEGRILEGLRECDWFLVALSRNSVQSDWVKTELHWALKERKGHIIPVLLEDCNTDDLHLKLQLIQHIDFRQGKKEEEAREELLAVWGLDKATQIESRYRNAQEALAGEDWAEAIEYLEAVLRIDPTHSESLLKLNYARQQQELARVYASGLVYLSKHRWQDAIETFQQVLSINSHYKDTPALIAEAQAELAKEKAAQLYQKALDTIANENWVTAEKQLQEVLSLDPTHAEAAAALSRVQKQKELVELYRTGLAHLQARRWRQALWSLQQVRNLDKNYKDVDDLIAEAATGLAEEQVVAADPVGISPPPVVASGPPSTRIEKKRLIAIGVVTVIIAGAIFVWLKNSDGGDPSVNMSKTANMNKTAEVAQPIPTPNKPTPPPNMAYVEGGDFMMGRNTVDGGEEYENPAHQVRVEPFYIDLNEVTREDYQKFVQATNHRPPLDWSGSNYPAGTGRQPVTGVTWSDANAYANWRSRRDGGTYRLPTEAEWEFAARGKKGWRYPWGQDWNDNLANANGINNGLADVGKYKGTSPYGAFDMAGNAWEWTSSTLEPYPGGKVSKRYPETLMVIRGGAYDSDKRNATTSYRGGLQAESTDNSKTGFRCVKNFEP